MRHERGVTRGTLPERYFFRTRRISPLQERSEKRGKWQGGGEKIRETRKYPGISDAQRLFLHRRYLCAFLALLYSDRRTTRVARDKQVIQ